jgi:hypothetical protein
VGASGRFRPVTVIGLRRVSGSKVPKWKLAEPQQ